MTGRDEPASFHLHAFKKGTGQEFEATLEIETERVHSVHLVDHTVVVFGELSTHDDIITIYDVATQKVTDTMIGDFATLSPDSFHMVFARFYPRFMPPEIVRSDVAVLYDLRNSPSANRVPGEKPGNPERVGIPIFPIQNAENRVLDPDSLNKDHIWGHFVWSDNSTRLGFVARRKNGDVTAVLGTLDTKSRTISVCEKIVVHQSAGDGTSRNTKVLVKGLSFQGDSMEVLLEGRAPIHVDGLSCDTEYKVSLK